MRRIAPGLDSSIKNMNAGAYLRTATRAHAPIRLDP